MLNRIIEFALRNRLLVLAVAALIVVLGGKTLLKMPVDVFPDLNRPTITVMTEAEGYAPEEVETFVTRPIEMAMSGLANVSRVRSTSGIGLSIVYIEFGWTSDLLIDRQLVAEKLSSLKESLPQGVIPVMAPMASIMGEIMLIGLTSESKSGPDLRSLADWTIRPRVMSVPGVAQVIAIGGGVKQFQINADPIKLKEFGVSFEDLKKSSLDLGRNTTGGYSEDKHEEHLIRNLGQITDVEQIESTPVVVKSGVPIPFSQLGQVKEGVQNMRGDASVNGVPGVILSVQKQPGANTVALTESIKKALNDLKRTLPPDVKIFELFKQADFISSAIRNVEEALRDGAILVAIVLFLFLLNFRTTMITLTAIPLSFLMTALVFYYFGLSINTMTLGGLAVAIGELVDDAIVDVENVFRRLRENKSLPNPLSPLKVIYLASSEVRNSIVIATIIVILVFFPLFAMDGIEGKLFIPLGIAYIVSILSSLIVSLTVTPVLASYLLTKKGKLYEHGDGALVRFLKDLNRKILDSVLGHPKPVLAIALALVLTSGASILFMGKEFLPAFNEGTVTISMMAPPGTSLSESNRMGTIAEKLLLEVPEVVSVGRRTGRAEQDEHAEGVHSSEIDVDLKSSTRSREAILGHIRTQLKDIPGVYFNIGQPISHRLDHLLSGVRAQIALKIFGEDLGVLRDLAQKIHGTLKDIPGVSDLQIEKIVLVPQIQVNPKDDKLLQYGIARGALTGFLENAFAGEKVSEVREKEKSFNIILRVDESYKKDPKAMGDLFIDTPLGIKVPLREIADIQLTTGPNQVSRENSVRRIVVSANTQGRDLGSTVEEIKKAIAKDVILPQGYSIELGGQFESQVNATKTISLLALLALLGIFTVLYTHFGSAFIALQIMLNIPLALIGSVVAVFLTGGIFSVATLVGFVTLCGIASRNGIMRISHFLHLMAYEGEDFTKDMVVRGSVERLVPVLMTALTAGLALIPIVLASGQPGKEILYPVAVVILGGILSSTLLDIVVTPVVFYAYGKKAAAIALQHLKSKEEKEKMHETDISI